MPETHPKILIFDSGIGGLSILAEISQKMPHCELVYACDNQEFPYGSKKEAELVQRVDIVLKTLIANISPDIVVVACNTASTVALPKIRSHFLKPVVGVVPAIKPAALKSHSKVVGLLGTPGTVSRRYTQQLINDFAHDCTIIPVGSTELVTIAEQKLRGVPPSLQVLKAIIDPIFSNPKTDTVILACTHFPLLADELKQAAPRAVQWLDSGEAIARRVASLLPANKSDNAFFSKGFVCWLTTREGDIMPLINGLKTLGATTIKTLPTL